MCDHIIAILRFKKISFQLDGEVYAISTSTWLFLEKDHGLGQTKSTWAFGLSQDTHSNNQIKQLKNHLSDTSDAENRV